MALIESVEIRTSNGYATLSLSLGILGRAGGETGSRRGLQAKLLLFGAFCSIFPANFLDLLMPDLATDFQEWLQRLGVSRRT